MEHRSGRSLPLSVPRRFVCDLLHFAAKVPTVPVQREMNVRRVAEARAAMSDPISWCGIFTKAYALAAMEFPELRRAYISFPWAHLYEHPYNVATIAVERDYGGEKAVFFGHIRTPETQRLIDIDGYLRGMKEEPVERFGLFRRALKISRLPWPVRRLMWWIGLNSSGPKRAKRMGTFVVSVYSSLGAESLHPLSPLTTALNYGVIAKDGRVSVRIIYDHRVMDGSTAARALAFMEDALNGAILNEMQSQPMRQAA